MRSRSRSTGLHFFAQMGHCLVRKQNGLKNSLHTHTVTVSAFGVTDIITSWKLAIHLLLHLLWQGHAPWQLFEIWGVPSLPNQSRATLGSDTMVDRLSRLLPAFMMMGTFDLGQSAVCSCNMLQPLEAETCDTIPYCSWRWKHRSLSKWTKFGPVLVGLALNNNCNDIRSGIGKNLTNHKPFGNYPGATVCNETKGVWK